MSGKHSGRRERGVTSAVVLTYVGLAALVAAVVVLGSWQLFVARSAERAQILADEASSAHLVAASVASEMANQVGFGGNLLSGSEVAQVFEDPVAAGLDGLVLDLHLLRPGFASVGAVSADGALLARWPAAPQAIGTNLSTSDFFRGVTRTGSPYVSPAGPQIVAPHQLVVYLAVPVRSAAGQLAGVIYATLTTGEIGSFLGGTSYGMDGAIVLVDQGAHAMTGPAAGAAHAYVSDPYVQEALAGESGSGLGAVPGFAGTSLVGYAPVKSLGWAVLVEEPQAAINGLLGGLTDRLLALGLIVLAIAIGAALMVARLLRYLTREREGAGALLRSVGEGVATVDPQGLVREMNPALEVLSGRSAREHLGEHWDVVLPLYDASGRPTAWSDSTVSSSMLRRQVVATTGYDLYLATAGGARVPVAVTAAPILVRDQLEGAVVVVRDVSREREVDQLKSSLVSTVSHELRTPLTMIQGFSELMLMPDRLDETQQREALEQIHGSAQRLGRLIDDLLSVARIESGKVSVDIEVVGLREILDDAVSTFAEPMRRRVEIEEAGPVPAVRADRDKGVQVVTNLVSNALKYSPPQATVRVRIASGGDHAEVSVTDEGIGMTAEEQQLVFEKFTRVDSPHVRKVGGTGLGLYITKSLVELMDGQLWVESSPGRGSRFTFSLPWAGSHQESDDGLASTGQRT